MKINTSDNSLRASYDAEARRENQIKEAKHKTKIAIEKIKNISLITIIIVLLFVFLFLVGIWLCDLAGFHSFNGINNIGNILLSIISSIVATIYTTNMLNK